MRILFFSFLVLFIYSCDTPAFDADRRQIMAKDAIHYKLGRVQGYDVTSFKEDTLTDWKDTLVKRPLQYTLTVTYKDSTGQQQERKGIVMFTPDGKSILDSRVE